MPRDTAADNVVVFPRKRTVIIAEPEDVRHYVARRFYGGDIARADNFLVNLWLDGYMMIPVPIDT